LSVRSSGEAGKIADPRKRAAYLDDACGQDQALRDRIEKMLGAESDEIEGLPASEADGLSATPRIVLVVTKLALRNASERSIASFGFRYETDAECIRGASSRRSNQQQRPRHRLS